MATHPNDQDLFQVSSSVSSPRTMNHMTSSPPSLPLFSDGTSLDNSSFLPKNLTASGSAPSSKLQRSCRYVGSRSSSHDANVALSKKAQLENDAMVYLDGPQVYTCGQCRTHLTSHDDIISKSFHGRKGRAYLFDQCVNIFLSQPEDRFLITGLHTVCDISCKRCQTLIGWTYSKAYEPSQKYKEGKFIIEKINLHLEEADGFQVERPAGERGDKWRLRSMSWGSEQGVERFYERDERSQYGCLRLGFSSGEAESFSEPDGKCGSNVGNYCGGASSPTQGLQNIQSNQCHPPPRTLTRHEHTYMVRQDIFRPMSPRSPSQIIYEYQDNDD